MMVVLFVGVVVLCSSLPARGMDVGWNQKYVSVANLFLPFERERLVGWLLVDLDDE